mgnify:FL=1
MEKLKIGEFSKRCCVPVKTLRYYDDIELFKPCDIDLYTGYRYYDERQLDDIRLIMELKEAGFSLIEIRDNWNHWNEKAFLRQREKIFQEQKKLNKKIKKLDELRIRTQDGVIYKNEIKQKLIRKKD